MHTSWIAALDQAIRVGASRRSPTPLNHAPSVLAGSLQLVCAAMVVYSPESLTSSRTLPSWALLAFTAGTVNCGAFLACQRFVAHVTGTLTMVGADSGNILGFDYLLVLFCFFVGAGGAVVLLRRFAEGRTAPYWIPLSVVALTLMMVALLGHIGLFGHFGGSFETAHDFALLCMLSFAMGMQNAAVGLSTNMAVRTTHMTGPATDLAIAVATLLVGRKDEQAKALQSVTLRGTNLLAFVLGGAAMVPLCRKLGFLAFIVPALACMIATARSYAPRRVAASMAQEAAR